MTNAADSASARRPVSYGAGSERGRLVSDVRRRVVAASMPARVRLIVDGVRVSVAGNNLTCDVIDVNRDAFLAARLQPER